MASWMIHTKSGKTYTDRYPHEIPDEEITSLERNVEGKRIIIKKSPCLQNFFVKTTESRDFVMMGNELGARPPVVESRAVGCHLVAGDKVFRLELECNPLTGATLLSVQQVPKATKDGF